MPTTHSPNLPSLRAVDNVVVVSVPFRSLDANNCAALKDFLYSADFQEKQIIIDLSSVSFIDSSGLGVLLSYYRRSKANSVVLTLCGITQPVRSIFELVRMHRMCDLYATLEQALAVVGK